MNSSALKISITKAEEILFQQYNIKGVASAFPGEIDLNFCIQVDEVETYILKISHKDEDENYLNFQCDILNFIESNNAQIIAPKLIKNKGGTVISVIEDAQRHRRYVRLLTWLPGRIWSNVNPQLDNLRLSLGKQCGLLTKTLASFKHPSAIRKFDWDLAQSLWIKKYLDYFSNEDQKLCSFFIKRFEASKNDYDTLRKSIVHNDANDNNVIVSSDLTNPKVVSIIDFGDAIHTQTINDLAITCAYAIMHQNNPLEAVLPIIKGYHSSFALAENELKHLYTLIGMRLVISVTKSAINKKENPKNTYLQVSEQAAWKLLRKWHNINPEFALYSFKSTCRFTIHTNEKKFENWALTANISLSDIFPTLKYNKVYHLDLSVSSKWIGHQEEFNNIPLFQFKIEQLQKENPDAFLVGGYLEPRPIYTSNAYDRIGNNGNESRCIHLGLDIWLAHSTPIHAFLDGEIVVAVNDAGDKEYGGLIILKHNIEDFEFFTLYGHLNVKNVLKHSIGASIKKGDFLANLGDYPENGNWSPHLHFQIMLSLLNFSIDFPGVAYQNEIKVWKALCPDPNILFKLKELNNTQFKNSNLIEYRKQHLGKNLSLQYQTPIEIVRGHGAYLIDQLGGKYLDAVNNVAHVGHEHYDVIKIGQQQMALLNTNTRYLHKNINHLTKELLETLPKELSVLHFVNSGSEANELALRMVKTYTGSQDMIVSEHGYHGNTNKCVEISSYKFDGKGGEGPSDNTHVIPIPDTFRGKYISKNASDLYAQEVTKKVDEIESKNRRVGGFIIEPIISCGGQIELPDGFLAKAYKSVKKAGGLCISDEVQTGCGRVGKTFWGFQLHDVIPDIVTIGKPLGNGHPIAAVACTKEVSEAFANGMEYFNTFGGNPVSCAIGTEVLKIVKREKLQEHALKIGQFLKDELLKLSNKFPIIGDVRGQGLFLGIEFVDRNLKPLKSHTDYIVNRMKDLGILMSSDGPDQNVLKIKPPLVFNKDHAKELIYKLEMVLTESYMKSY